MNVIDVGQVPDHDGGGSGAGPLWQRTEGALDLAAEVLRERDVAVGVSKRGQLPTAVRIDGGKRPLDLGGDDVLVDPIR